ncbi:MAG: metalloregulator ArsR/SmtB family transcription factor [Thermoanaerobacterales bacterium]|nr:metalloregulator ArsR/SmtB family transcription factor [Bacillota bacterium]MDI6906574.1 metalloregulator ArsR/SmtB family transcription factor [Thermoanaerobacterales bacterium]
MPKTCCNQGVSLAGIHYGVVNEETAARLAETFKVLADRSRVRIVHALSLADELCVGHLCQLVGMTPSAVSHQLRLLRGLNLVRTRREGQLVYYRLSDHHITQLFNQALEHVLE